MGHSKRPSARQRGYDTKWDKARKGFLARHRYCHMCEADGIREPATTVDHDPPHRGDMKAFWNRATWKPVCTTHHSSTKQRDERRGTVSGCNESGLPTDSSHHWHETG